MSSTRRARTLERFSENCLFEGIDADVLEKITPQIGVRRMRAGEVIFREGDAGDSLYLVGEGLVKISQPGTAGEQEIVGYVDTGNFLAQLHFWRANRARLLPLPLSLP
jgi:CRP-like cAMP-binding protein